MLVVCLDTFRLPTNYLECTGAGWPERRGPARRRYLRNLVKLFLESRLNALRELEMVVASKHLVLKHPVTFSTR